MPNSNLSSSEPMGGDFSREELFKRLSGVLIDGFEVPRERLVPEARLVEDLELDSLDRVDLVVRLEQEANLEIAEEELKTIHTVQDVVDLLHRKLSTTSV